MTITLLTEDERELWLATHTGATIDRWHDLPDGSTIDRHPEGEADAAVHAYRERLPSGDEPQEPSGAERSIRTSLACIIGGFHDRSPEQFRVDTLEFIGRMRERVEASRPPGGAEPVERIAAEACIDALSNDGDFELWWLSLGGTGGAHWLDRLSEAVVAALASEGAAPPPQPEHDEMSQRHDAMRERVQAKLGKPVEPSGVPDAPGMSLCKLYSVARTRESTSEERYGQALFNTLREVRPDIAERLKGPADPFYAAYHDDERLLRAIAVIESMWGGRCTPDADAGPWEREFKAAEERHAQLLDALGFLDEDDPEYLTLVTVRARALAGLRKRVKALTVDAERTVAMWEADPDRYRGRLDLAFAILTERCRAALEVQS